MRSLETLHFIAARVRQEWCVDRQPSGPLLGVTDPETCTRGHVGQRVQRKHQRVCVACEREREWAARARKAAP